MNNDYVEKRQCVRVVISVPAKVRLVDDQEAENLMASEANQAYDEAGDDPSQFAGWEDHLLPEEPPLDPRLTDFLMQIDEKLDRLLALLDNADACEDILDVRDTVDLSGTGIRLIVGEFLEVGQYIHITLKVPEVPFGKITAYGKVMRVSEYSTAPETLYEAGIRFFHLSRQAQEAIISYTFWKQRENIRILKDRKTAG